MIDEYDHEKVVEVIQAYRCQLCHKLTPEWINNTNTLSCVCKNCDIAMFKLPAKNGKNSKKN